MHRGLGTERVYLYLKKNWFVFFAILVYLFCTFYYMGPSLTNCQNVTYGFGDNTAGPIWRSMLPEEQGLLGASTAETNFPYGDKLYSPVGASLILQTAYIKGAQTIAGPVCGYNLVNVLGFMSSALLMCGLIYALTRNRWIALFSGFTASYTPYYQMKIGGHPSYGYQSIFIAIIWLFYRLIKYKRKRDAAFLALAFAGAVYFDPYFALYAALIVFALVLAWAVVNRESIIRLIKAKTKKVTPAFKKDIKILLLSLGAVVVLMLPLVAIFGSQGSQISSDVAAARGNTLAEAKACSNYPFEYLTPFILSPFFERVFGIEQYHSFINGVRGGLTCGIGEDTVGLSVTLTTLVVLSLIILFWEKINGRKTGIENSIKSYNPKIVLLSVAFIGLIGLIIAMPPVRFHGIPTPTYELLQITTTWRTLTRGYMLVNIALIIFSSIIIAYVGHRFKNHHKILIVLFVMLLAGVVIEYQAFKPFAGNKLSTFNYAKDAPAVYSWLKDQNQINVIAEYPLEIEGKESDAGSYYLTMQSLHKKKLFNSALSISPQEKMRSGLKNLDDPQTLGVLKAFGVDAVVAHGIDLGSIGNVSHANVLFNASQPRFSIVSHTPTVKNDTSVVLGLGSVRASQDVIILGQGFARNNLIINSVVDWKYEAIDGSIMEISGIKNKKLVKNSEPVDVCFDAQMSLPADSSALRIKIDSGRIESLGNIYGHPTSYNVKAKSTVQIFAGNGHNMRVSQLGCR